MREKVQLGESGLETGDEQTWLTVSVTSKCIMSLQCDIHQRPQNELKWPNSTLFTLSVLTWGIII